MRRVRATLERAEQDLRELGASFALAGGFAVSARTEPRTTRDVDFVVAVEDDATAEGLVADLGARGYRILSAIEHSKQGRLATVRLQPPGGAVVDLLFASSGVEPEIVERAERIEVLRGMKLAVPLVGHLLALKLLSRDDKHRPQDRVDLAALFKIASSDDLRDAAEAIELIARRGYDRGIDLPAALTRAQTEFR